MNLGALIPRTGFGGGYYHITTWGPQGLSISKYADPCIGALRVQVSGAFGSFRGFGGFGVLRLSVRRVHGKNIMVLASALL